MITLIALSLTEATMADQREVMFDSVDGSIIANSTAHAFLHDGTIGLTLVEESTNASPSLFTYSVMNAKAIDKFDLSSNFGTGNFQTVRIRLQAHNRTGTVLAYGVTSLGSQKIVALTVNESGLLHKIWDLVLPAIEPTSVPAFSPIITFNEEGTRIYVLYSDSGSKLALLNALDGSNIQTISLPEAEVIQTGASVLFDTVHARIIVETGENVYIFGSSKDQLEIVSMIPSICGGGLSLSKDGKFLISYGGYELPGNGSTGKNRFCSYDLEMQSTHLVSLKGKLLPSSPSLIFDQPTSTLFVPYAFKRKKQGKSFELIDGGSGQIDMLTLTNDGSLMRVGNITLPEHTPSHEDATESVSGIP